MLDEVDNIGIDWRGDPGIALLEVLAPAQNWAFRDHYLFKIIFAKIHLT